MYFMQVKVVVPNVTTGMIIGKGGSYIKQIKDDTGAFVQISQKSSDTVLVERVVTIAGLIFLHSVGILSMLNEQLSVLWSCITAN